jgi:hypothetical protein
MRQTWRRCQAAIQTHAHGYGLACPGRRRLRIPYRRLLTLRDAASYITKLPKDEHSAPEWQATMEALDPRCGERRPDDVGADRRHAGIEPRPRPRVHSVREKASLGAEKARERSMKAHFFIALAGLIVFAMMVIIVMQMKLQISPD